MREDRASAASERRRLARAPELPGLRERLDSGEHIGADDLAVAEDRMSQAGTYARAAHERAAQAQLRAANQHRAAAAHDAAGDPVQAARHRAAAAADDAGADIAEDQPIGAGRDE